MIALGFFSAISSVKAEVGSEALSSDEIDGIIKTTDQLNRSAVKGCIRCETQHDFYYDACPKKIVREIQAHRSGGLFGKAANKVCSNYQIQSFRSPEVLEDYIQKQNSFYFAAEKKIRRVAVPECAGSSSKYDLSLQEKFRGVSTYYYYMNRLQAGVLVDQESIASIDRLMGRRAFVGPKDSKTGKSIETLCGDARFEQSLKWCEKLKADDLSPECQKSRSAQNSLSALDVYVAENGFAFEKIKAIETQLALLKQQRTVLQNPKIKTEMNARIIVLEQALVGYYGMYPALKGSSFVSAMKNTKPFREALVLQLEDTRKTLEERLNKYRAATRCIEDSEKYKADCWRFRQTIQMTPPLPELSAKGLRGEDAKKIIELNNLFSNAECKLDLEVETSKLNFDLGLLAGTTVVSVAMGPWTGKAFQVALTSASNALNAGVTLAKTVDRCEAAKNNLMMPQKALAKGSACSAAGYGGPMLQELKGCMNELYYGLAVAAVPMASKAAFEKFATSAKGVSKIESSVTMANKVKSPQQRVAVDTFGGKPVQQMSDADVIKALKNKTLTWKQRGQLSDNQRIAAMEDLLETRFSDAEKIELLRLHQLGEGRTYRQIAEELRLEKFTKKDLKEKLVGAEKILQKHIQNPKLRRAKAKELLKQGLLGDAKIDKEAFFHEMRTNTPKIIKDGDDAIRAVKLDPVLQNEGAVENFQILKRAQTNFNLNIEEHFSINPNINPNVSGTKTAVIEVVMDFRKILEMHSKVDSLLGEAKGPAGVAMQWKELGRISEVVINKPQILNKFMGNAENNIINYGDRLISIIQSRVHAGIGVDDVRELVKRVLPSNLNADTRGKVLAHIKTKFENYIKISSDKRVAVQSTHAKEYWEFEKDFSEIALKGVNQLK